MSDKLTEMVIGEAIEVHRILGPRLLEAIVEEAFCHQLSLRCLACERQKDVDAINFSQSRLVDGIRRLSF